jgi:ABC-type transport system involved in multi-copper enzyme maturation permease subunit
MQRPRLLTQFELPLLKRELVEAAQRKRTYVLRVLLMCVLSLIFVVLYGELSSRQTNALRMLGTGRELAMVLIICDLVAVYALLPAMACAAISSEREKQTLQLLLIAKLNPGVIIVEKFISRMVPMLGLLVITTPLLALTYVLGGVTQQDLFILTLVLFTAAVQAASTAVFCSSFCATGLAAFWCTYLLLALMALGPPLLHWMDLLPDIQLVESLPKDQQAVPFTMFFLLINRMWAGTLGLVDVAKACAPVWLMSTAMLVAARFALVWIGSGTGLTNRWATGLLRASRRSGAWLIRMLKTAPQAVVRGRISDFGQAGPKGTTETGLPAVAAGDLPGDHPIAWREIRSSLMNQWVLHVGFVLLLGFFQITLLETTFTSRWNREEFCVMVDVVVIIVGLLVMVSQGCRMFAAERERQTLDALLTVPLSNRELLRQKQRPAIRLLVLAMLPVVSSLLIHLMYVQMRTRSWNFSGAGDIRFLSSQWFSAASVIAFAVVTHAIVYLSLARWVGILFGLVFRSQMKAMVASISSLLVLCIVPALLTALAMISVDSDPDDFPLFCFTSPAIIYVFALVGEISNVYGRSWFPDSDWMVLIVNLLVYGALLMFLRWQVLLRYPDLLNRRDMELSPAQPIPKPDVPATARTPA